LSRAGGNPSSREETSLIASLADHVADRALRSTATLTTRVKPTTTCAFGKYTFVFLPVRPRTGSARPGAGRLASRYVRTRVPAKKRGAATRISSNATRLKYPCFARASRTAPHGRAAVQAAARDPSRIPTCGRRGSLLRDGAVSGVRGRRAGLGDVEEAPGRSRAYRRAVRGRDRRAGPPDVRLARATLFWAAMRRDRPAVVPRPARPARLRARRPRGSDPCAARGRGAG